MSGHGYVAYTRGCRCDECRAAKSAYMRECRRVAGKHRVEVKVGSRVYLIAPDAPRHGSRHSYEVYACRCQSCSDAHLASDGRNWQAKAKRAMA